MTFNEKKVYIKQVYKQVYKRITADLIKNKLHMNDTPSFFLYKFTLTYNLFHKYHCSSKILSTIRLHQTNA